MLALVTVILLLPLAGCVATAQPAPQIDPADRTIVDAFLGHVTSGARYCTPERMARFAAQPEDITWQASKHIRMPLVAFQLTGEAEYLDEFVTRTDTLLGEMTEGPDGHPGWYGLALELFRHPDHPDEPIDVMITSLTMAGLMADFVITVRDAGLENAYAAQINRYLPIARALVDKWDARGNFRVLPEGGAVYITNARLKPVKAHLTQPHNKHSIAIVNLVSLYRATGEASYIEKAVRLGARFKRCVALEGGRYRWSYWDPAGQWDVDPDNPNRWKHWIGAEHRGGYYSHSLSQAVLLYELGLIFGDVDIQRFVRTQTEVAWNGSLQEPQWFRVDGRDAPEGHTYLCRWLAPYDERVWELSFGEIARAERLANKDHSWQGSIVAMGWLEDRYLVTPRWKSEGSSDADIVADWAAGEGAALLQELAYEVAGTGYEAPMTPEAMGID